MTSTSSTIELQATGVRFLSQGDERSFFSWLEQLQFIQRYEGRGLTLHVSIDFLAVDEEGLRELLAVFHRYGVDPKQLAIFDREEFADWFRNEQAYWHKGVFR
jgi:hypothetical protein